MATHPLFDKSGGYRRLHTFTYATLIHVTTISFCKRFIPWKDDPLGKTAGQMIGAARSGRQNIIEGSERSGTSKETEMKLTDVARGSLAELLGDYEIFLAERDVIPWKADHPDRRKLTALRLPDFEPGDDPLPEYWEYFRTVKHAFAPWVASDDAVVVANAMILLLQRTMAMLKNQIKTQGDVFLDKGGFREKMYQSRSRTRDAQTPPDPDAPTCPDCGQPMRRRHAQKGPHAGGEFWGCSAYPDCRGTRPIGEGPKDRRTEGQKR